MKKLFEKFKLLERVKKIELIIASLITLAILAGAPALAWFAVIGNVEMVAKIKPPDNLDIRAGHFQPIVNFDLRNIDVESISQGGENAKRYVFSVNAGDYKIPYYIQIAHTTNIPFIEYKLYWATEYDKNATRNNGKTYVEYHPLADDEDLWYYEKGEEIELEKLNPDKAEYGRTLGDRDGNYYDQTYASTDKPEIYAIPLYLRTRETIKPKHSGEGQHDYFILELTWNEPGQGTESDPFWNTIWNNKETDVIYITAHRTSSD